MTQMSEEEIIRNYIQIYKKLDFCRDEEVGIKQSIYNLLSDDFSFSIIQPADARLNIEKRLNHMSKQLLYTYYSIKNIKMITMRYIESNKADCKPMMTLLAHTERRFRYAFQKHQSNAQYAQEELGIYTQIPALA